MDRFEVRFEGGPRIKLVWLLAAAERHHRTRGIEMSGSLDDVDEAQASEFEYGRTLRSRLRAVRAPGSYGEARALAADAVAALEPEGATPSLAVALIELGRRHDDLGETEAAERRYRDAASVAGTLPNGEAIQAEALARLAASAQSLGRVEDARRLVDGAVAVIDLIADFPPGITAEVLVEAARVGIERGDDAVVGRMLDRASAAAEAVPEGLDRDEARMRVHAARGTTHRARGRFLEAEASLKTALDIAGTAFGPSSLEVAGVLNELGMTYKYAGRFDDGEAVYERARSILEAVSLDHPDLASIYHNLGGIAHARGDFAAAESPARRAVELRARVLGADHVVTVLDRAAHAAILDALGRTDEAEAILRPAVGRLERALGPDHHELAAAINNLAAILQRRGALDEAAALHERAIAIKERTLGPTSPAVAASLINLGLVRRRQGRLDEAERCYRRAITLLEAAVDEGHPHLAAARENLAVVLRASGRA